MKQYMYNLQLDCTHYVYMVGLEVAHIKCCHIDNERKPSNMVKQARNQPLTNSKG